MLRLLNLYSCRETLQRLDDYVDRELSPEETKLVQRHLKICLHCSKKFAFEERLMEEIRAKVRRITAPSDLMERISHSLSEESSSQTEE